MRLLEGDVGLGGHNPAMSDGSTQQITLDATDWILAIDIELYRSSTSPTVGIENSGIGEPNQRDPINFDVDFGIDFSSPWMTSSQLLS